MMASNGAFIKESNFSLVSKTTVIAKCYGLASAKLEIEVKPDTDPIPGRVYPKYEIRG